MSDRAEGWHCEAYPAYLDAVLGRKACFYELIARPCTDADTCATKMVAERQRLYQLIQELGAKHPNTWGDLASKFTSPDDLMP